MGEGVPAPLGAIDGETRKIATHVDLEPVQRGRVSDDRFRLGRRSFGVRLSR